MTIEELFVCFLFLRLAHFYPSYFGLFGFLLAFVLARHSSAVLEGHASKYTASLFTAVPCPPPHVVTRESSPS